MTMDNSSFTLIILFQMALSQYQYVMVKLHTITAI